MANYHKLIKVSCILCKYETRNDSEMEMLNDMDGTCPKCEEQFFCWENQDGSVVVSLTRNFDGLHTYDNLVWNKGLTVEDVERDYPTVEDVLEEMQKTNPIGWRLTYEYPDSIGIWHSDFTSDDQFIMFGDVNGYFAFNDVNADKVCGSMENIYEPAQIVKSLWTQLKEIYPDLFVKENN